MKTQRERRVVFEESTSEHYRVDILAQYDTLTLFVECKDYSQIKVDEKILFTLIGQIHDYRRDHPNETVVGILVTSAKNVGQNLGIHNKLLREGCQLWDGTTIQKMQDKMIEVDGKSEFTEYLFEKLGYFMHEGKTEGVKTLPPDQHRFFCRMQFFSIPDLKYIGNKFSRNSLIEDLKNTLQGTEISASIFNSKTIDSPEGQRIGMVVDFEKIISDTDLNKLWKKKSGLFRKPKESSTELMEIHFESACMGAITKTYGVETGDLTGVYKLMNRSVLVDYHLAGWSDENEPQIRKNYSDIHRVGKPDVLAANSSDSELASFCLERGCDLMTCDKEAYAPMLKKHGVRFVQIHEYDMNKESGQQIYVIRPVTS